MRNKTKYGVYLLRGQPFHNGHTSIVNQILKDGRVPLLVLGGSNIKDKRHPLSSKTREMLIRLIYPNTFHYQQVKVISLNDYASWDEWYSKLIEKIEKTIGGDYVIYTHEKEEDNKNFLFQDVEYKNSSYNECFKANNIKLVYCNTYYDENNKVVSATQIREDIVYAKEHLDIRVYTKLLELNFWKDYD